MSEFEANDLRGMGISLPPAPLTRPLLLGGAAATAGAVAWYWITAITGLHLGVIACGIGAMVGYAISLGGGYGRLHMAFAAVLVVLAAWSAAHRYYDFVVGPDTVTTGSGQGTWMAIRRDARRWRDLGDAPSETQIRTFASRHGYRCEDPAEFADTIGRQLRAFAEKQPNYAEWLVDGPRVQRPEVEAAELRSMQRGFESIPLVFHPLDVLLWLAGVATACRIVHSATMTRLFEELQRQRQAALGA